MLIFCKGAIRNDNEPLERGVRLSCPKEPNQNPVRKWGVKDLKSKKGVFD
jgi:hypothetical protein